MITIAILIAVLVVTGVVSVAGSMWLERRLIGEGRA